MLIERKIMNKKSEVFLTPEQLSVRWNFRPSVNTLANWRCQGKGPKYVNIAGVKYPLSEVEKYERKILKG